MRRLRPTAAFLTILALLSLAVWKASGNAPAAALIAVLGLSANQSLGGLIQSAIAGVMLRAEGLIREDVRVEIPGQVAGVVVALEWRITIIRLDDGRLVPLPNTTLIAGTVIVGTPNPAPEAPSESAGTVAAQAA